MAEVVKCCFKCHAERPLSEFYVHSMMADGHLNKCKDCTRADAKRLRDANLEEHRRRDRQRYYTQPQRRLAARLSLANVTPEQSRAYKIKWQSSNIEKRAAHIKVGNAIRGGRLVRQPCEHCNTTERVHAHHEDYSKPLAVRWLCAACHGFEHRKGA